LDPPQNVLPDFKLAFLQKFSSLLNTASWAINNSDSRASFEAGLTRLIDRAVLLHSVLQKCGSLEISAVVTNRPFNETFMKEGLPRELRKGSLADCRIKSSDVIGTVSFGLIKVVPVVDYVEQEGCRERRLPVHLVRVVQESTLLAYSTPPSKGGPLPDITRAELQDGRK